MATAAQAHREAESGVPDPLHECEGEIAARRLSATTTGPSPISSRTPRYAASAVSTAAGYGCSGANGYRTAITRAPPSTAIGAVMTMSSSGEPTVCPPPKK